MALVLTLLVGLSAALASLGSVSLLLVLWGGLKTVFPLDAALAGGLLLGGLAWALARRGRLGSLPMVLAGIGLALVWALTAGGDPYRLGLGAFWNGLAPLTAGGLAGLAAAYGLREVRLERPDSEAWELVGLRLLRGAAFLVFVFMVVFPFWAMVAASLKPRAEFLADPANLGLPLSAFSEGFWPGLKKMLVGYREVLVTFKFLRYIGNTAFVSISTMFITLALAVLGAYAVARLEFRGRALMERAILLTYMFPAIVLAIPLYTIFTQLGLRDNLIGLIIVYLAQTLPVALYMLRSYFETIPASLEEAGLIDGCSRFEVIWRITLPLALPALASVGLYVFMIAWNEFLFAFMFLDTPELFTLSRGMVGLNSQEVPRQFLMAGAVIVTVPIMILFFWFEKYLVGGLTAGGVKG
ncbi:carbohydrate ABC transporter permease [Deinococcota bacterium DY0809b]